MVLSRYLQRGGYLLELILVIAVIAAMLTVVGRQYTRLRWQRDLSQIQHSVKYLAQGASQIYFKTCPNNVPATDIYQQSLQQLPEPLQKMVLNPWAFNNNSPYQVYIQRMTVKDKDGKDHLIYKIQVQAQFAKAAEVVTGLKGNLNAVNAEGNMLTWSWLPIEQTDNMNSNLWVFDGGHRVFDAYIKKIDSQQHQTCVL